MYQRCCRSMMPLCILAKACFRHWLILSSCLAVLDLHSDSHSVFAATTVESVLSKQIMCLCYKRDYIFCLKIRFDIHCKDNHFN